MENGMIRSTSAHCPGRLSQARHRADEDLQDWSDNQARHPAEIRWVDAAFCVSWTALSLLWLIPVIAGIGSAAKLASIGMALVSH